jgi:ferrous iron transport protein A
MMPLGLLGAGETGEIVAVRTSKAAQVGGGKSESRIEDIGLRVGCTVEMLNNAGTPVLLKVGESRVAVDRTLAMKIMIKEVLR